MNNKEMLSKIIINKTGLDKNYKIDKNTKLLNSIPEFDSLSVVSVIEAIEDQFNIVIDDDEIDAEIFETFGNLLNFIEEKIS